MILQVAKRIANIRFAEIYTCLVHFLTNESIAYFVVICNPVFTNFFFLLFCLIILFSLYQHHRYIHGTPQPPACVAK